MPKVSVLLNSYNHEKYVATAIDSVLAQSFIDYELFIVDDCSADSSWDIIKSYNDPRIISIRNEKNMGRLIYFILHRSTGEYVAIHHSDDSWEPDKLQKQVEYMDSHPETIACFTHVQKIDENGDDFSPPEGHAYHDIFDQPNRSRFEWLRYFLEKGNALCHPSVLIRRGAFENYDLVSSGLFLKPDFFRWIRVCLVGEIHILQEKLTKFRSYYATGKNAGGDNIVNMIRGGTEDFILCEEFFRLSHEALFYKAFPENSSKSVVPEFVMAKKMIETIDLPKQLYGLRQIYNLLNIPETAKKIKDLHNYTYLDFGNDTKKYDVFSVKRHLTLLAATLYYDCGNGFNQTDALTESVYLRNIGTFNVKFVFPELTNVKVLRFDPDNGNYWDISIDSVIIDGVEQQATAQNAIFKTDNFDTFSTMNPIYFISAPPQVKEVEILGTARPSSVSPEKTYADNLRLKAIAQHRDELLNSTSWKVTGPLRAVMRLFRK